MKLSMPIALAMVVLCAVVSPSFSQVPAPPPSSEGEPYLGCSDFKRRFQERLDQIPGYRDIFDGVGDKSADMYYPRFKLRGWIECEASSIIRVFVCADTDQANAENTAFRDYFESVASSFLEALKPGARDRLMGLWQTIKSTGKEGEDYVAGFGTAQMEVSMNQSTDDTSNEFSYCVALDPHRKE